MNDYNPTPTLDHVTLPDPVFTISTGEFLSFLATTVITAAEDVWLYTPEPNVLTAVSSTGTVIGKIDAYPEKGDLVNTVVNIPVLTVKVIQATWKPISTNYVKAQKERGNKDAEHVITVSVKDNDLSITEHADCVPVGLRAYKASTPITVGDGEHILERIFDTLNVEHSEGPVEVPVKLSGADMGVLSSVSAKHDKQPVVFAGIREDRGWNLSCGDWVGVLV